MRLAVLLGLVATLTVARLAEAASGTSWTVVVVGSRELTVSASDVVDGVPCLNLEQLAPALSITVERGVSSVVIRDATGVEWHIAQGSVVLEGTPGPRTLAAPALIPSAGVYLPLDAIAALGGRRLVLEEHRAFLLNEPVIPVAASRTPAGWQPLTMAKTAAEIAEMRRLDGSGDNDYTTAMAIKEVLPPAHETLVFDIGAGVAGRSAATDVSI